MDNRNPKSSLNSREIEILQYLKRRGRVMKSELLKVVTSPPLLSRYVEHLRSQELLTVEENREKHRKFFIELTPKGLEVTKKLKEMEDITSGEAIQKKSISVELPEGMHSQIIKILKLDREGKSEQDFVIDAVKDKIRKWKKNNEEIEGRP